VQPITTTQPTKTFEECEEICRSHAPSSTTTTTTTTTEVPTTEETTTDDGEEFQCEIDPKTNLCKNDPATPPGKMEEPSNCEEEIKMLEDIIMRYVVKHGAPTQLLVDPKGKVPTTTPFDLIKSIAEKEKLPQALIDSIVFVEMNDGIMKIETKDPLSLLKILSASKKWTSANVSDPSIQELDVRIDMQ
jgi:hypothetical protein